jgi:hypothetical protein
MFNKDLMVFLSYYLSTADMFRWLQTSKDTWNSADYVLQVRYRTTDKRAIAKTFQAYKEVIRSYRFNKRLRQGARRRRGDDTAILLF